MFKGKHNILGFIAAGLFACIPLLVACGAAPAAAPVVIEKEVVVEKEVIKTIEVPGKTVTTEVIKEVQVPGETVVVTKEVVKEVQVPGETVVVEVERRSTEAVKSPYIGKLEGPTVLVNFVPAKYSESPDLAALVASGDLPTIEDRVGSEPLVLRPTHEIGVYGGTWERGFIGPNDTANAIRAVNHDRLFFVDVSGGPETGSKIVPHMAKSYEISGDGLVTTVNLRKGHRWSDGAPFTADDIVWWYENMYLHSDIYPGSRYELMAGGEPVVIKKVDETTVQFISESPNYILPTFMSQTSALSGHARWGKSGLGGFAPAHYLKQFHPDFVQGGLAAVKKMAVADDYGEDEWVTWFKMKNSVFHNTELPALTAWILDVPITQPSWEMIRNPYAIWMDEAGNQLPYMDKVRMRLGEDLEVLNLRAIAGEYGQQARHMDLMKLPVFIENMDKGGYDIHLDPTRHGGDAMLCINQGFEGDMEVGNWLRNADFRRALSLSIDRDSINEVMFLGLGVSGSIAPGSDTMFSPGPEEVYRKMWSTHDVETANQMLDGLGLTEKDSEGYRQRLDGKGRLVIEMQTYLSFMNFTKMGEMVKENAKDVGIYLDVKEYERSLAGQRRTSNEHHIHVEVTWGAEDIYGHPVVFFPGGSNCFNQGLAVDFRTTGEEPSAWRSPEILKIWDLYSRGKTVDTGARVKMGQELWRIVLDQVYAIGVVGQTPAIQGVRIASRDLGNIAERHINSAGKDNPASSHPEQYYIKADSKKFR